MDPDAEPLAKENDIVYGLNKRKGYRVIHLLGQGAFGAVFEVERIPISYEDQQAGSGKDDHKKEHESNDGGTKKAVGLAKTSVVGGRYAMKCEVLTAKMKQLKMELELLRLLATKNGRHFCDVYDRAKTDKYKFIVMTLAGKSLSELKYAYADKHFSLGTALRVGIQCLEALEDLHEATYLHRDVKPANFASGGARQTSKILMLDFGLARNYKHADGRLKRPREKVGFRGTIRYAPLACHRTEDMGRKDDVESWFYMQVEILVGILPWRQCGDKLKVQKMKEDARGSDRLTFLQDCPKNFDNILSYIDNLKFWSKPDYEYIYTLLRRTLTRAMVLDSDAYDWELGGALVVGEEPPAGPSEMSSEAEEPNKRAASH